MCSSKESFQGLSRSETAYLEIAISLAKTSKCRQRHGAVIVSGGRVIATGVNQSVNDPRLFQGDKVHFKATIHAEARALGQLGILNGRATLYVARVNRRNEPRLSRPCSECYKQCEIFGIRHIIYTVGTDAND